MSETPNPHEAQEAAAGAPIAPVSGDPSSYEVIRAEHRRMIAALSEGHRGALFVPSAEGITLYQGIESHSANGHMRALLADGHRDMVKRALESQGEERGTAEPE